MIFAPLFVSDKWLYYNFGQSYSITLNYDYQSLHHITQIDPNTFFPLDFSNLADVFLQRIQIRYIGRMNFLHVVMFTIKA